MKKPALTIALAGNPNSGKTTIFNAITAGNQKVGNYSGVTVEKIEGEVVRNGRRLRLIDLPGTYSLTAHSIDEIVARDFILDEKPDVIVNIVDAANLERNLYLTMQLMELDVPMLIALNKFDVSTKRGFRIDTDRLSALLGVPISSTVASEGKGLEELIDAAIDLAVNPEAAMKQRRYPTYGPEIEPHVQELAQRIEEATGTSRRARWFAVKLIENDMKTANRMMELCLEKAEESLIESGRHRRHLEKVCGDSIEIVLADKRYGYISGACTESLVRTVEDRHDLSDQIDRVLTHPVLGLPIFAGMMYLLFQLTFWLGEPMVDFLDSGINEVLIPALDAAWHTDSFLKDLLLNGIIAGVGAVLTFVPLIVLVFLGISILEDSGYMARAAFIMDKLMHKIGLHGHSFVPMLIGFGCTVPAIMATRALKSRRDRFMTIMILPLMSCGARIPIYMLIIPAFFPKHLHTPILWLMYIIGIVIAIIVAKILAATFFRGQASEFVMELPPYRRPTLRGLIVHIWERTWMYLKKAGTVILAASVILWVLTTYPRSPETGTHSQKMQHTVAGRIGTTIEPAFRTMGFDWKIGTSLIGAFAAKEVFVTQLGIVYAAEEGPGLQEKLREAYSPLVGFCIMLFCLISLPCIGTLAATIQETGSWRWGLLQTGYLTVLAWIVTTIVYQTGSLFL